MDKTRYIGTSVRLFAFQPLKLTIMANLQENTIRRRAFPQDDAAETIGMDYGHEDDEILEPYDEDDDNESSSNPSPEQSTKSTASGKDKFSDPRYGYVDELGVARTATGRRRTGRYDELVHIAGKPKTNSKPSNFEGFKDFETRSLSKKDEARTLLNTQAFAKYYKFQSITAVVWTAFLENAEMNDKSIDFSFPPRFDGCWKANRSRGCFGNEWISLLKVLA